MHSAQPSLNHLAALPSDTARIDAGLLQPKVLDRLARNLPGLAELTAMIDDPAALDGPPLPTVRRLRLLNADGLADLWPRLRAAFPGLRSLHLVDPTRLSAADLKPLAEHGLRGLGLFDPPADAAAALDGWPGPDRVSLRVADPAPWLGRLDAQRVSWLAVHAAGPVAGLVVDRFGGPVLRHLDLRGATDVDGRLAALTGLEALSVASPAPLTGLSRLEGLRRLEIDGDPHALELAQLRHLERLAVRGSGRFDGGALTLVAGLPRLDWLDVSDCPGLAGSDLMALQTGRTPRALALALRNDTIGGGLVHLRGLGIRRLDLRGCALDADDFAELGAMTGLVRLDLDLLAWAVDREARRALLAAQPDALAHYRYSSRPLPDGAVEETVCDAERPWITRTRVEGVERDR